MHKAKVMTANKYLTKIKYVDTQKPRGLYLKEHPLYVFNITLFLILRNRDLLATFDILLKIPTKAESLYPDKLSASLQFLGRLKKKPFLESFPNIQLTKS